MNILAEIGERAEDDRRGAREKAARPRGRDRMKTIRTRPAIEEAHLAYVRAVTRLAVGAAGRRAADAATAVSTVA